MNLDNLGNIAVLVVDMQNDFCHSDGVFSQQGLDVKPAQEVEPRIQGFLDQIRQYNVPIIYSKQIESEEASPDNLKRQFQTGKLQPVCSPGSWGAEFYGVEPAEGEYVLEKHTYDVFSNPELDAILSDREIKTLVISGVNTDVCIDATVRRAFTEEYLVVVPRDLVATMNAGAEDHYLNIFDRFLGTVTTSERVLNYLESAN